MRKLSYNLDNVPLVSLKAQLVPALFTAHQFELLHKKQKNIMLSLSEKNEFSRAISRKMNGIYALMQKNTSSKYIYGRETILPTRLTEALSLLKKYTRKFKNKHIIIMGSFLYNKKYNDIDIIVISKYEKPERFIGEVHISYFTPEVYGSLFFASVRQLCISNQEIELQHITEKISVDTFISLYQELLTDLDRHPNSIKSTLRDFVLQAAYLSSLPLPHSKQLNRQTDALMQAKMPKEVLKNIFIQTLFFASTSIQLTHSLAPLIHSYRDLTKEYPQHKSHYTELIHTFQQVMAYAR